MDPSQTGQPEVPHTNEVTPSVSTLLSALDFEIGRISSERQRPGWSLWAVYGGLASALWLLFEQLEKKGFTWLIVLQLFLIFNVSKELLLSLKAAMERPISGKFQAARFKFFSETQSRVPLLLTIALNVGMLLIAIATRTRVGWFSEVVMLIFLGGNIAFATWSLIRSFSRALIRVTQGFVLPFPYSLVGVSIECLFNFVFFSAALGYTLAVVESHPTIADLRVAALLFVVFVFLSLMVREDERVPLLSSLQDLRSDVALGRAPVAMAVGRMDEILVGMRAPRAFQEDLEEILDSMQSISTRSERLISIVDGYRALLKSDSGHVAARGLEKLLDLLKPEHDDILDAKRTLVKKKASLRKRIDRLVRWEPYVRVELTELLDSVQQREVTIEPAVDAMSNAIRFLQDALAELTTIESNPNLRSLG